MGDAVTGRRRWSRGSGRNVQALAVGFAGRDYPGIWALDADVDGLRIGGGSAATGSPARRDASFPTVL